MPRCEAAVEAGRDGVGPSWVALPPGPWPTIVDFLVERFPRVPAAAWRSRAQRGELVDARGQAVQIETPYAPHTKVRYFRDPAPEAPFPFDETVLFQDELIVVADKPHFMPVTPSGRHLHQTLLVRLRRRLGLDTLAPVHRIDRDTAGIVLFTVRPETRGAYQALFRDRIARKHYEAVAALNGAWAWPLTHRSRLAEGDSFMRMREVPGEPNSETVISLLEARGGWGRFSLQPLSGKRHQLRVHMAALGMPMMNDGIYPVLMPERLEPDHARPLQLVARGLAFTDPVTGQARSFESAYRVSLPA